MQIINSNQSIHSAKMPLIDCTLKATPKPAGRKKPDRAACSNCRLQTFCLAKNLNGSGLERLGSIVTLAKPLRKNQHLYRQGDEFNSIYFIRSGSVKSYIVSAGGDELAVSFYMPGEIIGFDGLYSRQHTGSIIALQDAYLCEIPYAALESLCASEPLLQRQFNKLQSRQIIHQQEMTMLRSQKTAAEKLTAFLWNMSQRYKRLNLSPVSFCLPMTRKDIAGCLGLSLETVSRILKLLQDQDLIKVNGREITLTNLQRTGVMCH
jgi:CRP/FNR family transcriptional regulator